MAFVSPSLIARIYKALGQDRAAHAMLLLRQHARLNGSSSIEDSDLIAFLAERAAERIASTDDNCAEEHLRLGIALYESCLPGKHADALQCAGMLMPLLERQGRIDEGRDTAAFMQSVLRKWPEPVRNIAPLPLRKLA